MSDFSVSLKKTFALTKKNVKIYYLKPPVLIFGLIFPFFLFLAFALGRNIPPEGLVPALIGVTVLFTASAVGPLITPWERQLKTYERLFSSPLSLNNIVMGDVLSGFLYGGFISLVPLLLGVVYFGAIPVYSAALVLIMIIALLCFSALGSLLASLPTEQPSSIMMLANLVRLPLLFISGVFIPLTEMSQSAQAVAMISPLTYTVELVRWTFGQDIHLSIPLSLAVLTFFTIAFLFFARLAHKLGHDKKFN